MAEQDSAPTPTEREEAREYAVQRLGIVSAVIWVVVVMGFMWFVFPLYPFKPTVGALLGTFALALAFLPWAAYPILVERNAHQRAAARARGLLPPTP